MRIHVLVAYVGALLPIVCTSVARGDEVPVIKGQTAEDRLAFLRQAEQSAEQSNDLDYLNRLFAEALGDPSPQVRSYAAYGLRDSKYVAILITTMTIDPDRGVRQLASDGLDHWLTDNGVETCQDSATVEKNLNQLLKGLDDFYTVQNTVEIWAPAIPVANPSCVA